MSLKDRIEYHTCVMVYKALNNQAPEYISDLLNISTNNHTQQLRSEAHNMLCVPRSHTSLYDKSFSISAPKSWNNLPSELRQLQTLGTFKRSLTKSILAQKIDH